MGNANRLNLPFVLVGTVAVLLVVALGTTIAVVSQFNLNCCLAAVIAEMAIFGVSGHLHTQSKKDPNADKAKATRMYGTALISMYIFFIVYLIASHFLS